MKIDIELLINKYSNYLYAIANNMSKGILKDEDIEELISDAFVIVWKKQDTIEEATIKPYISQILRNLIKNKFKEIHFEEDIEDYEDLKSNDIDLIDMAISDERNKIIFETLNNIKEEDKKIFISYYCYNVKIKDISKSLNISEINVKVKLHRVRNRIKTNLRKRGYNYGK